MAGKIEIINEALRHLGQMPIQHLEENSTAAIYADSAWNSARRAVLEAHNWTFATKVMKLALFDYKPLGFRFFYAIPADCLRIIRLRTEHGGIEDSDIHFDIRINETGVSGLVTDLPFACAEYVTDLENTNNFSAGFAEILAYKLASDLALPITGQKDLVAYWKGEYEKTLAETTAIDARTRRERKETNDYVKARY